MKRISKIILVALLAIVTSYSAYSAVQQGYSKTPGRLGENGVLIPGKRLPNVVVSGKGLTRVISGSDGSFSISFKGSNFVLSDVTKSGYALVDREQLRQYSYSKDKLVLVLEDTKVQDQERLRIERQIRRTMRRALAQKEEEIERLRAENKITQSQLDSLYRRLYDDEQSNQKLVSEMAEEYAKTDFDSFDDFRRKVTGYIISGDLVRADSLLNSKGSVEERIAEIKKIRTVNAERSEEIRRQQDDLEKSKSLEQHKTEDLASDMLSRYELCYLRHDADSAAYWLELRYELDTTNIDWIIQAGRFFDEYIGDSSKALEYYRRGLRLATKSGDKRGEAICGSNIGAVIEGEGKHREAMEYFNKSLEIFRELYGEDSEYVFTCYNNIADCYNSLGKSQEALDLYGKNLETWLSLYGEQNNHAAAVYNNIGTTYYRLEDYDRALEYMSKALEISELIEGEYSSNVATGYNNLGSLYVDMKNYDKAFSYLFKALEIRKTIYTDKHPMIASNCFSIAKEYDRQQKYSEAFDYYLKSLNIYKSISGNYETEVSNCFYAMGNACFNMGRNQEAIDYSKKALEISLKLADNDLDVANIYFTIGFAYARMKDYDKSISEFKKSLKIKEDLYKCPHRDIAVIYDRIGFAYQVQGKNQEAMDAFEKAIEIGFASLNDEYYPDLLQTYISLGQTSYAVGRYEVSLNAYKKVAEIRIRQEGNSSSSLAVAYRNIAESYKKMGFSVDALEYDLKAYKIYESKGNEKECSLILQQIIREYGKCKGLSDKRLSSIANLIEGIAFYVEVKDGETEARKQGMKGEYLLLEYGDWNIASGKNLYEVVSDYEGKPKDIAVKKAGVIERHHFEGKIGIYIKAKHIGKKEKQHLIEEYRK